MPREFTDDDLNVMKKAHIDFRKEVGAKLLTASKIKDYFKSLGLRSEAELAEGIADHLYKVMWKASSRAMSNKRTTVRSDDV